MWLAPAKVLVQEIDHHNWFPRGETTEFLMYNRLTKDTNLRRWEHLIGRIRIGAYSNRATNFGFDLTDYYEHQLEQEGREGECKFIGSAQNWRCHV